MPADESIYSQALRANIRAELARHEVARNALVPVLHLSKSAVYARMRGERPFTADEIAELAAYLGIAPESFWPAGARPLPRRSGEIVDLGRVRAAKGSA